MMSQSKPLRLADLNDEQFACLRDHNRRAEAHRMLDDLEARCGYDVEKIRALLPPLGRFRAVVETYTFMREVDTGGGNMAVQIPCPDGTHVLLTDAEHGLPADDAQVVLVSRYRDTEPVCEPKEVRIEDLERVIDGALDRPSASCGRFREIIGKYPNASEETTGGGCMATYIPCDDGTHLLITDLGGFAVPANDARVVLIGRYGDDGVLDITPSLPKGEYGAVEVRIDDLERVIDEALGFRQVARGQFRAVMARYPEAKETTTGGNCTAIQIPCADGTYLLLTDPRDAMSPDGDAETVCVSRHNDQGTVAVTSDLRAGEDGTVEVPVEDLARVLDAAMGRSAEAGREPSRVAARAQRSHRSKPADFER